MINNIYVPKILDVIIPSHVKIDQITYLFIVTEYEEYDLQKVLDEIPDERHFEQSHLIEILYNLLCAINYIHSAGVLHRDIQPGNILIGDDCTVKICDFGISRSLSEGNT